jgi:hypothetical protein
MIKFGELPGGFSAPREDAMTEWHDCVSRMQRRMWGRSFGPVAPKRKRPKRVAKKIAARGGMLRARGVVQSLYRASSAMRFWWESHA